MTRSINCRLLNINKKQVIKDIMVIKNMKNLKLMIY